jgi:hypothetical protein
LLVCFVKAKETLDSRLKSFFTKNERRNYSCGTASSKNIVLGGMVVPDKSKTILFLRNYIERKKCNS